MAQQHINVGTTANDGTGDSLRVSQQKAEANFSELYGGILEDRNLELINTTSGAHLGIGADTITFTNNLTDFTNIDFETPIATENPKIPNKTGFFMVCDISDNYANDTLASAGGIRIGQCYHTGGILKIRLT